MKTQDEILEKFKDGIEAMIKYDPLVKDILIFKRYKGYEGI